MTSIIKEVNLLSSINWAELVQIIKNSRVVSKTNNIFLESNNWTSSWIIINNMMNKSLYKSVFT